MANKNLKSIKFPGLGDTYIVPQVDTTLTQTGRPADAKATGDAISALGDSVDEDIDALKEDLSTLNTEGTVPTSEQMLSENVTVDSVPYHFRKTASDNADREELEIVGGSVAWNQLADNSVAPTSRNGLTITGGEDGFTIDGTATANTSAAGWFRLSQDNAEYIATNGHKVIFSLYLVGGTMTPPSGVAAPIYAEFGGGSTQVICGNTRIVVPVIGSNTRSNIYIESGVVFANAKFRLQAFDLTAMFGSTIADHIYSLEQATAGAGVALFKSLFPKDYYAYDAGSMQSVSGLSAHQTVGFNQFDESLLNGITGITKAGDYWTGTMSKIAEVCSTTGPVFGGLRFFEGQVYDASIDINIPSGVTSFRIRFIYTDGTYSETAKSGAYEGRLELLSTSGKTVKGFHITYGSGGSKTIGIKDICINLSDPSKNGTYEPYNGHSYALDDSLTLRGISKLVDGKIKFDGDIYSPSGKVTRRFGIVDLGNATWTYFNVEGHLRFGSNLSSANYGVSTSTRLNAICNKYEVASYSDTLYNTKVGISIHSDGSQIVVYDPAYTDAVTFKSAMSGVYLVYELATPTTEQADPYVSPQICDPSGTEEFVSTGIVPVGHVTKYPDNMKMKLDNLPWNFANLIAPTESAFKATRNYTTGALLIVNNVLYKATANIANGGTITPNTNVTATTLAEIIAALS